MQDNQLGWGHKIHTDGAGLVPTVLHIFRLSWRLSFDQTDPELKEALKTVSSTHASRAG